MNPKLTFCLAVMFSYLASSCIKRNISAQVPMLDEVSGIWVSADTAAMEPSLRNFRGQALVNRDVTSLSWLASAPYSGGYHTGVMKINGGVPIVSAFRWLPYEALRKSEMKHWTILSSTRMLPDENGILWRIEITNKSKTVQDLNIDLDMIGFISKYGGEWQWWYPYPSLAGMTTQRDDEVETIRKFIGRSDTTKRVEIEKLVEGKPTEETTQVKIISDEDILNSEKYSAVVEKGNLYISDSETDAIVAFGLKLPPDQLISYNSGGAAKWQFQLQPGEKKVIEYYMTYGDDKGALAKNLDNWKENFDQKFNQVKTVWEERWQQIFTPGNPVISGCFPVLETDDTLAKKVYYTGPLTMLYLMNTHLPQHEKVFLTGGPRWGASITFFWDITEWSTLFAVADPLMMKEHISSWISIDPSKYYGKDNFSGKGVGNGYSANYWALFQLIHSYITVTGDYAFLDKTINGKTILETLDRYATHWENISIHGKPGAEEDIYRLADFGDDEWNLLECVPTYKHIVPSFNAGYIWMMRETAEFYNRIGNEDKAKELTRKANGLVPELMKLYAGNGVWNSLYPDNKTVEVRHCLDFMFLGRYLPEDLSNPMKAEMIEFVYRELITDHWMRAQSLEDVAAKNSDRPDHGPLGAFDGWPAGTMDALAQMGYSQKALDFYHAIEPVTYEGCWAQAHELWGKNKNAKNARVRIAERGWHNRESSAGIALSQVMLKNFFGFYPEINDGPVNDIGDLDFQGTLHHVLYQGEYYTISKEPQKTAIMTKEKL